MTIISTARAGIQFGDLTIAYTKGAHDIACRCCCGRLVHVARASLIDSTVTSCGCRPRSRQFHTQQAELHARVRCEVTFSSALMRK